MQTAGVVAAGAAAGAAAGYLLGARSRQRRARDASSEPLDARALPPCPLALLREWLGAAEAADGWLEARTMTLATSSAAGGATARSVLLQDISASGGLIFGSSAASLKARQLAADPRAEAVLRWGQRQVRMRGAARRGTADETLASWRAQPLGARLGLAMLRQGEPSSEAAYEELRAAFAERQLSVDAQPAPACPHAGYSAFVLEPTSFEFYLGGHPGFLNDRFLFVRDDGADAWRRMRLQA